MDWLVSSITGGLAGFLSSLSIWAIQTKSREKGEVARRANLLHLFADEAVRQYSRFVQYCEQAALGHMSFSRPYEMLTAIQIQELIALKVEQKVLSSIYQVRQLNAVVTLQVDRSHAEYSKLVDPKFQTASLEAVQASKLPIQTFGRCLAFIMEEYKQTREAVDTILIAAEGVKPETGILREQFLAACSKYDEAIERMGKKGGLPME